MELTYKYIIKSSHVLDCDNMKSTYVRIAKVRPSYNEPMNRIDVVVMRYLFRVNENLNASTMHFSV